MLSLVQEFAKALDSNDFAKAGTFMAEDCRYRFRDQTIVGREDILESYSSNYEAGTKKLDEIVFLSEVFERSASEYRICYTDRIRKGEVWHEHRCEQIVHIDGGKIIDIQHIDLPGEAENLQTFYKAVGLA